MARTVVNAAGRNRHVSISFDGAELGRSLIPAKAAELVAENRQRSIPKIAKDPTLTAAIDNQVASLASRHELFCRDSRGMEAIEDNSVQLVVTSPPYWSLKKYDGDNDAQLGDIEDYDEFLSELDRTWRHVFRVLEPGGRLVIVVGDVCLSRRDYGRHVVFPLHASIQEHCRAIGFDNLAPIIWYKIANAQFESEGNGGGFLGKPYEPNAVVKNDIEYILFQRVPGGYRQPTLAQRILSVIPQDKHRRWFQQVWTLGGASTKDHPAPYPVELAERLVKMFSFVGDTVLDPFLGTGSTSVAAARSGRNSIGFEIEPQYFELAMNRLRRCDAVQLSLTNTP